MFSPVLRQVCGLCVFVPPTDIGHCRGEPSQHKLPDGLQGSPIHPQGELQLPDSLGPQPSKISGKKILAFKTQRFRL